MHIAIGYNDRNKTREKFYRLAKSKGYKLLTYVSSKCTNYAKKIGDNCFIFEDNTLQPFVEIGNNCILWSGNHVGIILKLIIMYSFLSWLFLVSEIEVFI